MEATTARGNYPGVFEAIEEKVKERVDQRAEEIMRKMYPDLLAKLKKEIQDDMPFLPKLKADITNDLKVFADDLKQNFQAGIEMKDKYEDFKRQFHELSDKYNAMHELMEKAIEDGSFIEKA